MSANEPKQPTRSDGAERREPPPSEESSDDPSSQSENRPTSEHRRLLTWTNVATALLVATSVLWAPPLFFGVVGVLDNVRDFARGYEGEKVESLREYLDGSDIWSDDPQIFGSSLRFIERYSDHSIVSVSALEPVVKTPGELNEQAVSLRGDPIVLVGRVLEYRQRTSDGLDYSHAEIRLAAPAGGYVWCGLGGSVLSGSTSAERGDVVVLRGVVTAVGPVGMASTRRQVAYFTALATIDYFDLEELPPNVRAAVKQIRMS